jgi:ATP-binding cassette, subfamily B, bacterial IrtA/YbtP
MSNLTLTEKSTAKIAPAPADADAWTIMDPVRGRIRIAMTLAVSSAVLGLATMGFLALTVRDLLESPGAWPWSAMLGALICTVSAYLLRLAAFNESHFAAFRLETLLRSDLSRHLAQVPMGYIQAVGAGALAKVMHDDVKALHVFVADSTPLHARAYAVPAITFLVLLTLDWRLALAAAAVLALGFGVMILAMRNRAEMVQLYNEARERVGTAVVDFVQAMPVVRTFDSGTATFGRYRNALREYLEVLTRWYREAGFPMRFSMAVLNPMPTLAVLLWLGAWLTWRDSLPFAQWLAVLLIGTGMAEAMMPLIALKHLVDKTQLSIARIQEVLSAPVLPEPDRERMPTDASVRFESVGFRYGEMDGDALSDVSFAVAPGSVVALVGPSGAGKSTVAKLIPRFWDVSTGRILVGGVDVREMSTETLMSQVAFVFQDTFLFSGSIADNIRLGLPDAGMDAVSAAAGAAQAHDFIMSLPQGYDTQVGERGLFLSGGQRQRITIARAILQDRPILVLDEATAYADPENEAALVAALSELMRSKTVIMVAHRLATIRDADQILVFEHGRLVETGRHETLLARAGIYARLWRKYEQAQDWALCGRHPTCEQPQPESR